MRAWRWVLAAVVVMGGQGILARADEAGDVAMARGKAMVAAAKWRVPSIEGMWRVESVPGGPVIVLAEKSITALSKAEGKVLWKVAEGVDQPIAIGGNDKVLVVQMSRVLRDNAATGVTGISLVDGTEKYQLPGTVGNHQEQVRGNRIIVETGLVKYMPFIGRGMPPRPHAAPQLTGYDLNTGKQLWQRDAKRVESLEGFISDTQYLTILNDVFTMVDAATGVTQWERPIDAGWKAAGELLRADGTGLFLEHREGTGILRLLTVDLKTGKTVADEFRGEGFLEAARGDVLMLKRPRKSERVRGYDSEMLVQLTEEDKKEWLTGYDVKAGKVHWTVGIPQDQPINDTLTQVGDVLLQVKPGTTWVGKPWSDPSGSLAALDMGTGKMLWKREHFIGAPVVYKETVIFSGMDYLEAVDRREGKVLWSMALAGPPCELVVAEGVMYFGVMDNGEPKAGRVEGMYAIGLEGK